MGRRNILFGEQLQCICHRLEKTIRPLTIGTDAILDAANHLARDPNQQQGKHQRPVDQNKRANAIGDETRRSFRRAQIYL